MIGPVVFAAWAVFGLAAALIAQHKGRNGTTFFIAGLVVGPVSVLIALFSRQWYYDPEMHITGDAKHLANARADFDAHYLVGPAGPVRRVPGDLADTTQPS